MRKLGIVSLLTAAVGGLGGCLGPAANLPPLQTAQSVDLTRYTGLWYEVAKYPVSFQRGCTGTTAEYTLRADGRVTVVNRCFEESLSGPVREIEGTARVVNTETNAKLKVTFFWPFEGDYWIIDLDDDYQWAVVGVPSRQMLWILSRTPELAPETYADILSRLPAQGYDPTQLELTDQPAS